MTISNPLKNFKITTLHCDIDTIPSGVNELEVQAETSYREPKDATLKRILLETKIYVKPAGVDNTTVAMVSLAEFDISEMKNDLASNIRDVFFPIVKERMSQALESITRAMSVAPIKL